MSWSELHTISTVTVVGFFATIIRLWASNERAKAEWTINMLLEWTETLSKQMDGCVRLSGVLSQGEIESIWRGSRVEIEENRANLHLLKDLIGDDLESRDGKVLLTESQASVVEYYWKTYLNRLEFMLTAWREGLVDEDIIANQLGKFVEYKSQNIRKLIGTEQKQYFPTIDLFLEQRLYCHAKRKRFRWLWWLISHWR